MIKRSVKLEVICRDENGNVERLNYNDGKYFKSIIVNRPHMAHEGILSYYNKTAINLLEQSIDFQSILPQENKSYSLVINSYDEYISQNTSIIKRVNSEEISSFGNNLFVYGDAKSENITLVSEDDLDYLLKLFSKYIKTFSNVYGLSNIDDMSEKERNEIINKIKLLYANISSRLLDKEEKITQKLELKYLS